MGGRGRLGLRRCLAALVVVSLCLLPALAADTVAKLIDNLQNSRSYKVRVQAAALLSKLRDPRAAEALVRAADSDRHPTVRAVAAKQLAKSAAAGRVPVETARQTLTRVQRDPDPGVRRQANSSIADLDRAASGGGRPAARPARGGINRVAVGSIGDRTGRASRAMRERLRAEMLSLLQTTPRVEVASSSAGGLHFLVDGTIAKLSLSQGGPNVEATCAVDLVVSRPPRGIVTVASGEAIVQKPRLHFQPVLRDKMEMEALEHAVRSAHQSLAQFLAGQ